MSKHRFTIEVEVDDDALARLSEEPYAPPAEVDDWDGRDLANAIRLGAIDSEDGGIDVFDYSAVLA